MNKKKLHRIKLIPATSIEEMCLIFHLDPKKDYSATKKLRVWYRPCQKQILMF